MVLCGLPLISFLSFTCIAARAFLPGVGPNLYKEKDEISLFINELTSTKTQIPYDYYSLPFCSFGKKKKKRENLGEGLEGEVVEESGYKIVINSTETCTLLCEKNLAKSDITKFKDAIDDEYLVQMTIDGIPAAYEEEWSEVGGKEVFYSRGFPIGFTDYKGNYYIYNHLRIQVAINPRSGGYNIVGFIVDPYSFDHSRQPDLCEKGLSKSIDASSFQVISNPGKIKYSYDIVWEVTDMPWTQRWDIYMRGAGGDQIHWFSILNSSLIVLFLSALVAMILLRTLRSDIAKYNESDLEDAKEESGWKLVHGDVFRPPHTFPTLFAVYIGTGVQLTVMVFLILFFAMLGLVSPTQRGNLLTCTMLLFVLMGSWSGYYTARIHKMFRGMSWVKVTVMAASLFPALCFTLFSIINTCLRIMGSTGAIPFGTLLTVLLLWLLVQAPLVFIGSYFGFKKEVPEQPVRTNQIPRQIPPQPWFLSPYVSLPFGGILPFGAISVELYFILSAFWLQQLYYIFSFLFLVMLILILTSAEISIVLCYFQLCAEDHRWWWKSILWAGSCSGYMFLYSAWYFLQDLDIEGIVPVMMYFGYSALFAFCFALVTGTIGYFSCFWFISKIYGSIKVD